MTAGGSNAVKSCWCRIHRNTRLPSASLPQGPILRSSMVHAPNPYHGPGSIQAADCDITKRQATIPESISIHCQDRLSADVRLTLLVWDNIRLAEDGRDSRVASLPHLPRAALAETDHLAETPQTCVEPRPKLGRCAEIPASGFLLMILRGGGCLSTGPFARIGHGPWERRQPLARKQPWVRAPNLLFPCLDRQHHYYQF